jgi:hypothetical protein
VAARLRKEHRRELAGISLAPEALIGDCRRHSLASFALVPQTVPILVGGVEPAGAVTGAAKIWMLGTPEIDCWPKAVLRAGRWAIGEFFRASGAGTLEAWIPEWYETGLRFIDRLGFRRQAGGRMIRATRERT